MKILVWAGDKITPLYFTGIVSDNKDKEVKIASSLKSVIEYHLGICTNAGSSATMKVTIGDGVGLNTIIGMSMIKSRQFNLDIENGVATSGVMDCSLFLVTYKAVTKSVLDFSTDTNSDTKLLTNKVKYPHITYSHLNTCMNHVFGMAEAFQSDVTKVNTMKYDMKPSSHLKS